ncbi:MAG: TonB family protein [Verrucomicrobiota bacterium]
MSEALASLESNSSQRFGSLLLSLGVASVLFVVVLPFGLISQELEEAPESLRVVKLIPPPDPEMEITEGPTAIKPIETIGSPPAPVEQAIVLEPLPTKQIYISGLSNDVFTMGSFPVKMPDLGEAPAFEVVDVRDLDRIPKLLSNPARIMPYELLRENIRGKVRLKILIQPDGRVEVLDVIDAEHKRLIKPARRFAEKCRFEPPLRNNIPVATAYVFPISF